MVSVSLTEARRLEFKVAACASTGNLALIGGRASQARPKMLIGRLHPARPGDGQGRHHRHLRGSPGGGGGQLRRGEPPLRRAGQRASLVGLRRRGRCAPTAPVEALRLRVAEQLVEAQTVVVPIASSQLTRSQGFGELRTASGAARRPASSGRERRAPKRAWSPLPPSPRGGCGDPSVTAWLQWPSRYAIGNRPTVGTRYEPSEGRQRRHLRGDDRRRGLAGIAPAGEGFIYRTADNVTRHICTAGQASGMRAPRAWMRRDERVVACVAGGLKTVRRALASSMRDPHRHHRPRPSVRPAWTTNANLMGPVSPSHITRLKPDRRGRRVAVDAPRWRGLEPRRAAI